MLVQALKLAVSPPLCLFLLAGFGWIVRRWRPRLGRTCVIVAGVTLVLLMLPVVAAALLRSLQRDPPLALERIDPRAGAIVVLGADFMPHTPEYGQSTVGWITLERVRYGAFVARRTGLPVLVSGGDLEGGAPPLAVRMQQVLEGELGVPVRWTERRSRSTLENARFSAEILSAAGIERVLLVTHAWHMPRARRAFEAAGLEVVAAPTGFRFWPNASLHAVLPSARSLLDSSLAIHEWTGRAWYALLEATE